MHLEKHILHEHGRSPHKYQHAQGSNLSLAAGRAAISRLTLRFMTERHLWCGRAACKACGEQLYQQGIAAASLVQVGSRAEARKQQRKAAQGCKQRSDPKVCVGLGCREGSGATLPACGGFQWSFWPGSLIGRRPIHYGTVTFLCNPRDRPLRSVTAIAVTAVTFSLPVLHLFG